MEGTKEIANMFYKIKNSSLAAHFSAMGGELVSLQKNGTEYLWQGDAAYWSGQAPVCFPIVGGLPHGKATAYGVPCAMPRHGVARTQEFQLDFIEDDWIQFSLNANQTTLSQYPFSFRLLLSYHLTEKGLTVTYTVENHSSSAMPFALGGHPAFRCPLAHGESFNDYQLTFHPAVTAPPIRTEPGTSLADRSCREEVLQDEGSVLPLRHSLFYKDALIFEDIPAREVIFHSQKSAYGVRLRFEDYPHLLLWSSSNDGKFIAIEPWSAMPPLKGDSGKLEERKGYLSLPPGGRKKHSYHIDLLDGTEAASHRGASSSI